MRRDGLTQAVIDRLERLPAPFDAHFGVVPCPPPEGIIDLRSVREKHVKGMRALQRADRLAARLPNHFPLTRILVRQEAVNSSSIEDTHSTLDAVLEADEAEQDENIDNATRQVREYAIALEGALHSIESELHNAFSVDLIKKLHKSVMAFDTDYKDKPGDFRQVVNWIGAAHIEHSSFNPPPPARVLQCIEDHVRYLRTDAMEPFQQSIITRLAVAHAHFEATHPFRDGNGRVGRLLLPLMMAAGGHAPLYLSPYINANKSDYINGLKEAQQRLNYAMLVGVFCDAIESSVTESERTISAIDKLVTNWRSQFRFRSGSAADRAIGILSGYPVMTANRLAKQVNVTYPAANTGIAQLVKNGILSELTGKRRNRIFVARDILRIFNRPFGEDPSQKATDASTPSNSG